MADCTTLQQRIAEAEEALHKLQTGGYVVELTSPDGTRIRYGEADAAKLGAYLQVLHGQLAQCEGSSSSQIVRRPVYFTF